MEEPRLVAHGTIAPVNYLARPPHPQVDWCLMMRKCQEDNVSDPTAMTGALQRASDWSVVCHISLKVRLAISEKININKQGPQPIGLRWSLALFIVRLCCLGHYAVAPYIG